MIKEVHHEGLMKITSEHLCQNTTPEANSDGKKINSRNHFQPVANKTPAARKTKFFWGLLPEVAKQFRQNITITSTTSLNELSLGWT